MFPIRDILLFFLLPVLNFTFWFHYSKDLPSTTDLCPTYEQEEPQRDSAPNKVGDKKKKFLKFKPPEILAVNAKEFNAYAEEALVEMFFPGNSKTLLVNHHKQNCSSYINPMVSIQQECLGVVIANTESSHNLLRFNDKEGVVDLRGLNLPNSITSAFYALIYAERRLPNGFFKKGGNPRGRNRLRQKIGPLFENLDEIETLMRGKFSEKDVAVGSDVVVMVVNDGELDLFLNFACSCHDHDISMNNMIVFAGSK
jgi:hypothetical protein